MTEKFITEFTREYGLKEGIMLSILCEEIRKTNKENIQFTMESIRKRLKYFTPKQLRTGVAHLLDRKGIKLCECGERDFSRTLYYTINEKVFVQYLKILNQERAKTNKKISAGI
jgi:hypothetical protein